MPGFLSIPERYRARAIHEKARARERGSLTWIRSYLTDVLDDDELASETPTTRYLWLAILHLAARNGWVLQDDYRRIAGLLTVKPQDVKRGVDRLVELGRIDRIVSSDRLEDGSIQLRLQADQPPISTPGDNAPKPERAPSEVRATSERPPSGVRKEVERSLAGSSNGAVSDPEDASRRLAQQRQEQRREEPTSKDTATRPAGAMPLPGETLQITRRIIAVVARSDPRSANVIAYEAHGLPENLVARAFESLQHRHPRPRNPAGYIVNALRGIRSESGLPDTRPRIEREPERDRFRRSR